MLVSDVMLSLDKFPVVRSDSIVKTCIEKMGVYRLGICAIISKSGQFLGVFTDGDLRRTLLKIQRPIASLFVDDVIEYASRMPLTVSPNDSLELAIELMGLNEVWDLPVTDHNGKLIGLLHLHPAVKSLLKKF